MAKDDYDILVFRILTYLYGCLKRKIIYNKDVFYKAINKKDIDDSYFTSILVYMSKEGYIDNLVYTKAWGNEYVIGSCLEDIEITQEGIHYLKENNVMNNIKNYFLEHPDFITALVQMVLVATK